MDLLSGCLCFRGRQTTNGRLVRSEGNKAIECGREKVSVVRVVERGLDFMGGSRGWANVRWRCQGMPLRG